jgi:glutaryl-CoA dehydrogenase (non-decarboxylating)
MDLELTDEQRDVQETVRAFVDDRVLPNAVANDQAHRLDMDVIAGMAKLGLLGVVIPQEYGGGRHGLRVRGARLRGDRARRGGVPDADLGPRRLNSLSLLRYGSEEVKQRFLVPQATGEKLGCFGLTEPEAGSDVAAMRTTAKRRGDTYVLNGQKAWISYASVADHALVFAKTDPSAKHKGITAFIVEMSAPGVSAVTTRASSASGPANTGELFFDDVEVPRPGRRGRGPGLRDRDVQPRPGRFTVAAARSASSARAWSAARSTRTSARRSASPSGATSSSRTSSSRWSPATRRASCSSSRRRG